MEPSERRKIALETLGVVKERKFHKKKNKKRHPRKVCTRLMDNDMPQKRKRTYFSCSRKVRYSSESDAHKMAKHSEKVRGVPLRVYYCSICNGWHITKKVFRNLGKRK